MAAADTRREILRAARRLFAEHGFASTSVQQIAEQAGVAVQTIYSSVGSKSALLLALNDLIDEEADVAGLTAELLQETGPPQLIAKGVHLTRQLNERCGDLIQALLSAEPGRTGSCRRCRRRDAPARARLRPARPAASGARRTASRHHARTGQRSFLDDDVAGQLAAAHPPRRVDLRRSRSLAHAIPHPAPAQAEPLGVHTAAERATDRERPARVRPGRRGPAHGSARARPGRSYAGAPRGW